MVIFNCFSTLLVGKKKSKGSPKKLHFTEANSNIDVRVQPEEFVNPLIGKVTKEPSFEFPVPSHTPVKSFLRNVKMEEEENKDENLVKTKAVYDGGGEHDEILLMKSGYSDFDIEAQTTYNGEFSFRDLIGSNLELNNDWLKNRSKREESITQEMMFQSEHASDPQMGRTTAFWGSPKLKRSYSNIETKRASRLLETSIKSYSYSDPQNLSRNVEGDTFNGIQSSPISVMTNRSADRVMLKKRSSGQVLPSSSRKLWWKLFLWSHRNVYEPWVSRAQRRVSTGDASIQNGGYTSDSLEFSHDMRTKKQMEEPNRRPRIDLRPQNQWVAFPVESSSIDQVNAWVNGLEDNPFCQINDDNDEGEVAKAIVFPKSPEIGEPSRKNYSHSSRHIWEIMQANSVIQSLNSLSSVAQISGVGLKVIPTISSFTNLRSINLSGNIIVHVYLGSLPKSLQNLDLSNNKIATIEGLGELTKLRVLNLSYNRISRIGHGLSNCTLIKELYLAGNKISNVEGLHRLSKLTVLDLSFNKIATKMALGHLVANYNSLLALNLLGNPIQGNIGDDQLWKAVSGFLPQLAYLNKQLIKPQRSRDVATDSVAKAAVGNDEWSSRRRLARRVSEGSSSLLKGRIGERSSHGGPGSIARQKRSKHSSKSKHQQSISQGNKYAI